MSGNERGEEVGSLGEEAAKLIGALSEWAREHQGDPGALLHEIDEHVATGSAECRYCPVCQVISGVRGIVRETSPEVREHLTTAASALVQAAVGLMASTPGRPPEQPGPVQRIDLDD